MLDPQSSILSRVLLQQRCFEGTASRLAEFEDNRHPDNRCFFTACCKEKRCSSLPKELPQAHPAFPMSHLTKFEEETGSTARGRVAALMGDAPE